MRADKCPEELAQISDAEASRMLGLGFYDRLRQHRLERRVVSIEGEIYSSDAARFNEELEYLINQDTTPIKIIIHSQGGEVQAGLAIYDYIMLARAKGIHVTTMASGTAASMACIVLQAGSTREMMPNARLLIHEVSQFKFFSNETTSDLAEQVVEMKKLQAVLSGILAEATGRTQEEVEQHIWKKDLWFNLEEALEYGLIDKVVTA